MSLNNVLLNETGKCPIVPSQQPKNNGAIIMEVLKVCIDTEVRNVEGVQGPIYIVFHRV